MAINYSNGVRNAQLEAIETLLLGGGGNPRLYLYTGAKPATCAASDPAGSVITAGIDMTATPFAVAANGQIGLTAPLNATASPGGTGVASFRIKDSASVCHIQGTVGTSGTDLVLNTTTLADQQAVTITAINIFAGNA
jgi:hypothetical protein